jgi:shikimate kinase
MKAAGRRETIALLGMRCSGKSTVGALLAAQLGLALVDLDLEVARSGRQSGWKVASAGELLERAGQARFRDLEAGALRRVLEPGLRLVLATGGGVVERADNCTWLARSARCVFLSVPVEVLAARLAADPVHRPALLGDAAAAEVGELLRRREFLYRELSEAVIECGEAPPPEIAREVRAALGL